MGGGKKDHFYHQRRNCAARKVQVAGTCSKARAQNILTILPHNIPGVGDNGAVVDAKHMLGARPCGKHRQDACATAYVQYNL